MLVRRYLFYRIFTQALLALTLMLGAGYAVAQTSVDNAPSPEAMNNDIAMQLGLASEPAAAGLPTDIVLLLDNSGSMKSNDPKFLTSRAVTEFINQLDFNTRLGIVIFDQKVKLALPLTDVNDQSRAQMLESLKQINYRGLRTNSPDGLERAIYELKLHARQDTERFIVFLTDGIVDTGDKTKDATGVDWMRKELAADAKENNIRIFGIAFTEGADFKLIQSLAQQTDADYYRAFTADDIAPVFTKIYGAIAEARQKAMEPVIEPLPAPEPVAPVPTPAPAPEPIIVQIPEQAPKWSQQNQYLLFGIVGLLIVLLAVMLLRRSGGVQGSNADEIPEVKLIDTMMVTGQKEYQLKTTLTQVGRVKGKETPDVSHIVIDKKSISRHHAVIEYRNHAFWLMDQGSGNGTMLNGKQINDERRLKHGDVISFDTYEFMFMEPELEQSDATVVQASPHAAPAPAPAPEPSFDEDETAILPGGKADSAAATPEPAATPTPPPSEPADDMAADIANWDFEDTVEEGEKTIPPGAKEAAAETESPASDIHDVDTFETDDHSDLIRETEDGGFEPSKTMTPDEFDRLFNEIDKNKS